MSRHDIIPKNPRHEAMAGWDPGLGTYFATVGPPNCDSHELLVWLGTRPCQYQNVDKFALELESFASIPQDIRRQMREDRNNEPVDSAFMREYLKPDS